MSTNSTKKAAAYICISKLPVFITGDFASRDDLQKQKKWMNDGLLDTLCDLTLLLLILRWPHVWSNKTSQLPSLLHLTYLIVTRDVTWHHVRSHTLEVTQVWRHTHCHTTTRTGNAADLCVCRTTNSRAVCVACEMLCRFRFIAAECWDRSSRLISA